TKPPHAPHNPPATQVFLSSLSQFPLQQTPPLLKGGVCILNKLFTKGAKSVVGIP
ncbi:MAG: hypothetical protein ACI8PG_005511, partial [Planctomycetota bacterium]